MAESSSSFPSQVYFSLLGVPQWVERSRRLQLCLRLRATETCCGWKEQQRCRFPRDLLIHDFSLRTCGLLTLPWSVCALCRAGSDGSPPALLPLRQVSLHEEKMSVMLCRWEQKNVTMKLVGCFLLLGASLLLRNV